MMNQIARRSSLRARGFFVALSQRRPSLTIDYSAGQAWPFRAPVSELVVALPDWSRDYHGVISRPMDLGTVARRLRSGEYLSPKEVGRLMAKRFLGIPAS